MKRGELLRRIGKAARKSGVKLVLEREGGRHSVYRCGSTAFTVPRHSEINEYTALGIMTDLEGELGERWWR